MQTYSDLLNDLQQLIINKSLSHHGTPRRPAVNQSEAVKVGVSLQIDHVSVDQKEQTIKIHGLLYMVSVHQVFMVTGVKPVKIL